MRKIEEEHAKLIVKYLNGDKQPLLELGRSTLPIANARRLRMGRVKSFTVTSLTATQITLVERVLPLLGDGSVS